jgi:hypothetical protein
MLFSILDAATWLSTDFEFSIAGTRVGNSVTRASGKGAKNNKLEARNPKFETISNAQNILNFKQASLDSPLWISQFEIYLGVCCEFQYSNFGFIELVSWRAYFLEFVIF